MEKFSTEYFHKLANDLKFDLSDEEIEELKKILLPSRSKYPFLKKWTPKGRTYGLSFETPTVFLREDVVSDVLTQEEALKMLKMLVWDMFTFQRW